MAAPLKNYSFDHVAKTVTLTDVATVRLDRLKLIVDVTIGAILYNFASSAVTATVATNVVTLSAVPGGAANTDKLVIVYDPISTDTAFADVRVPVDGSAVTQPVSGTVTTAPPSHASTNVDQLAGTTVDTGSGNKSAGTQRVVLATDQPALTAALKVDGSAVTQPVSAASLPLPSGAATAAKQPAPGTAGTASADVVSIQGVASMTAVKTDGSAVTQPVSSGALPTVINKHVSAAGTLTASTVATQTLTQSGFTAAEVEITNVDGAAAIYVTLDGSTPSSTNFAACLPATPCSVALPSVNTSPTIKLISAGTPAWAATLRGT